MVDDAAYGLTAEALAYARKRYETTDQPVRTIAHDVGISRDKLYKIIKAEGWQLRRDQPPRGLSEALKLDLEVTAALNNKAEASQAENRGADPDAAQSLDSVAARLEAQLDEQLREVESLRGEAAPARGKRSADAERLARTLAILAEALFKVRRLRQSGGSQATDDDDLPADPDEFRLALAARIEAFVRNWTDPALSGPGKPGDAEALQS